MPDNTSSLIEQRFNLVAQLAELDYIKARKHSPLAYAVTCVEQHGALLDLYALTSPLSLAQSKGTTISFNQHGAAFKTELYALDLTSIQTAMDEALTKPERLVTSTCVTQLGTMREAVARQITLEAGR